MSFNFSSAFLNSLNYSFQFLCVIYVRAHSAHVFLWGLAWRLSMLIRNIQHALSVYTDMVFINRCKHFSGLRTRQESDVDFTEDLSEEQTYKEKLRKTLVNEAHCYSGFLSIASLFKQHTNPQYASPG